MEKKFRKILPILAFFFSLTGVAIILITIFFDQAVIVRRDTIYRIPVDEKVVALTFDDGPSSVWTPRILDELKKAGVKATFFMLGEHVKKYPEIARRVSTDGHEIGNHTYDHHLLIDNNPDRLSKEIKDTEKIIRGVTGKTTVYFRPPKAWLTAREKKQIGAMGYTIVLWTLNSKDWVGFDDKYIIKYLLHNIKPGDIILFHDGGGAFSTEGGNRDETVKTIPALVKKLKDKGYKFLTITELLRMAQTQ